jgi:hypothetical protein
MYDFPYVCKLNDSAFIPPFSIAHVIVMAFQGEVQQQQETTNVGFQTNNSYNKDKYQERKT